MAKNDIDEWLTAYKTKLGISDIAINPEYESILYNIWNPFSMHCNGCII